MKDLQSDLQRDLQRGRFLLAGLFVAGIAAAFGAVSGDRGLEAQVQAPAVQRVCKLGGAAPVAPEGGDLREQEIVALMKAVVHTRGPLETDAPTPGLRQGGDRACDSAGQASRAAGGELQLEQGGGPLASCGDGRVDPAARLIDRVLALSGGRDRR